MCLSATALSCVCVSSQLRLQKEANRRIADLAEKAHSEAVTNLDERTKEVYRENVQMADALRLHMEHEETLRKSKEQLEMANRSLLLLLSLSVDASGIPTVTRHRPALF